VLLYGFFLADPTTTNTDTVMGMSLPIASDLTTSADAAGTAANILNESVAGYEDTTNNRITWNWKPVGIGNSTYQFNATYTIK
jgi:hypothetical protein